MKVYTLRQLQQKNICCLVMPLYIHEFRSVCSNVIIRKLPISPGGDEYEPRSPYHRGVIGGADYPDYSGGVGPYGGRQMGQPSPMVGPGNLKKKITHLLYLQNAIFQCRCYSRACP